MHTDKLKKEMITRDYYICVDQDFIDTYYLVFKIYSEHDVYLSMMMNKLEPMVSDSVRNFNFDIIKKVCIDIEVNIYVQLYNYRRFTNLIFPYYERKFVRNKTAIISGTKTDKNYYVIKLNFEEIMIINAISGWTGGSNNSSRRAFIDNNMRVVVTSAIFGEHRYISSGGASRILFHNDILKYIDSHEKQDYCVIDSLGGYRYV